MDYRRIDFEQELSKGPQTYERILGRWWQSRSQDASHGYAYRRIADHLRALFGNRPPERIIDYACGGGNMLARLCRRFPRSRLMGIDGSSLLLQRTRRRLRRLNRNWKRQVGLIHSQLPDFSLPPGVADVVIFLFPNIVPDAQDNGRYEENGYRHPGDEAVARYLAQARERDPQEETVWDDPETVCHSLLTSKVIARNLRHLLKRGGICVRADYANAPREELTELVRWRLAFEEGSLDVPVDGHPAEQIFAPLDSVYCRSRVVEDVYQQTRDETDREGGYLISTLAAM